MVFRDLDKKSILENSARILSTISVVGTDISFTEETNIAEWSYEDYRFVPENGFIGQFTERLLDGKLKGLESNVNIENAEINLKIGIINGIDNKTTYYDYGNFLITKVGEKDTTGTTSFESADFVKKFNQVYVDTISYPCLALELTNNVCEQVGVELAGNGKAYCIAIDDEGLEQGSYAFLVDNTYYNFNTTKNLNYHDTIMLIKIDNNVRIVQKTVDTITYNVERVDLTYTTSTEKTNTVIESHEVTYCDFTNNDFSIENNQFDEGTLCRDVIKNIAKIGYTWARVGVDNKLYLDFTPKTSSDVDEYNKINTDQYYSEESQLEEYGPVNKVLLGLSNVEGENVYKEQKTDEVTICNILGATSQASIPTPTSPVPVKVVNSVRIDIKVNNEVKSSLNVDLKGYDLCNGDTLVINNGYGKITKHFAKVVFTGTEPHITRNVTYSNNHYRYTIYSVNDYKPSKNNESIPNIKCDKFVAVTPNQTWGNATQGKKTGISVPPNNNAGAWFISYESDTTDTLDKFRAWLRANPTYAYYELEKPIEIDLGYVGDIELFEGNDVIAIYTTDTDTTGIFVVSDIYKNTTKYVGNNIEVPVKGYKTCQINLYDNPILYTQELRQIALNGCEKLFGLRYLPFTTKTIGHPWLEGDDYIQLDNLDGKTLYTYPFDRKLEYKGYIKSDIASTAKTDIEQKYEFESELLSRIVSAEIIVNKAEATVTTNTQKIMQLEQGIENANINTNNLRDSINQTLTDYAKSEDVVQLRQAVETQQTETNLKIEIINEVLEGGISKVKTSKGYTFDDEGLKIADSESEITSKLDNKSFEVRDNTSGHADSELLYAGIDVKTNESVVRSENLTVRKYFNIGTNSRLEDFEKNNKPGTGVFFVG
nr:MAG TPA: hypothetical protein [Bacteriophage sp.]